MGALSGRSVFRDICRDGKKHTQRRPGRLGRQSAPERGGSGGCRVGDRSRTAENQAVAYTYFRKDENEARQARVLTHDVARRVAAARKHARASECVCESTSLERSAKNCAGHLALLIGHWLAAAIAVNLDALNLT